MEQLAIFFSPVNFMLFAAVLYLVYYPIAVFFVLRAEPTDKLPVSLPVGLQASRKILTKQANIAYVVCLSILLLLSEPTRNWRELHMPYLTTSSISSVGIFDKTVSESVRNSQEKVWTDKNLVCDPIAANGCRCINDTIWNPTAKFCDKSSFMQGTNTVMCPQGSAWVNGIKPPKDMPDRDPNLPRCAALKQVAPLKVVNANGSVIQYVFTQADADYVISIHQADGKLKTIKNEEFTDSPD